MDNTKNILKWLNNEMSAEELKEFQQTEDYRNYIEISKASEYLDSPNLNPDIALADFKQRLAERKETKVIPLYKKLAFRVAASVLILLGLTTYFLLNNSSTTISTQFAENKTFTLQDESVIQLNAGSSIRYKKEGFENNRQLNLEGEAFFDVVKKGKFVVETSYGDISVLGTSFNIKSRKNDFTVFCFTGKVQVKALNKVFTLTKGEGVRLNKNKEPVLFNDETLKTPNWMNKESVFYEVPYQEVIDELERQYNVKISLKNVETDYIFTGAFDNNNLDSAIKSVTLPLNLKYQQNNNLIEIFK